MWSVNNVKKFNQTGGGAQTRRGKKFNQTCNSECIFTVNTINKYLQYIFFYLLIRPIGNVDKIYQTYNTFY